MFLRQTLGARIEFCAYWGFEPAVTNQELIRLAQEIGGQARARLRDGRGTPIAADDDGGTAFSEWSAPAGGIAPLIDHTLLRPDASDADVVQLCQEARKHGFATVCVHPCRVALAAMELRGTGVPVCTVIGFPHGANVTPVKCAEAEQALKAGARELDMVARIGALKAGDLDAVYTDIRAVAALAHQAGAKLKVILEMAYLDETQKMHGCATAKLAGADFVKTSTGFATTGAQQRDVALLRRVAGEGMGVKAAGGIRCWERFQQMMAAGATRIGASASLEILRQCEAAGGVKRPQRSPAGGV